MKIRKEHLQLANCYFFIGMLVFVAIVEIYMGRYLRAANSMLYAFICIQTTRLIRTNIFMKKVIMHQHKFIEMLRSAFVNDEEMPEEPALEKKEDEV